MPKRRIVVEDEEEVDDKTGILPLIKTDSDADENNEEEEEENVRTFDSTNKFNYETVYENYSKEIPLLIDIKKESKKFGDAHRYILQKMICDPCISLKKFYILFIEYVVTVQWNHHPCVVKYIKGSTEELRDLAKAVVRTINETKQCTDDDTLSGNQTTHNLGMRISILSEERTIKEWVTLSCDLQNSEILGDTSEITAAERNLFLAIMDEMFENNGTINKRWVSVHAVRASPAMTLLKCEAYLERLIRQKWVLLSNNGDKLEMSPRTLAEMDPYLRNKYGTNIKSCELCRRIISRIGYTAKCKKCAIYMHFNCFKHATEIAQTDAVECVKCNSKINMNEVIKTMKELLENPSKLPKFTKSPSLQGNNKNSDVKVENDDDDEDMSS